MSSTYIHGTDPAEQKRLSVMGRRRNVTPGGGFGVRRSRRRFCFVID